MKKGCVFFIGAGPGDPSLLTLKAKTLIEHADVIIHDALSNPFFLKWSRPHIDIINVGKRAGKHLYSQSEINQWMIRYALKGFNVVRLKGGDPLIFGRLGEELESLYQNQIDFKIIPGVSSAIGCAAFCGIPLTHRDLASSVTFITAQQSHDNEPSIDWKAHCQTQSTLVIFMMANKMNHLPNDLIEAGFSIETPVAFVSQGTSPNQKTIYTTLGEISKYEKNIFKKTPSLLFVGPVVELAQKYQWDGDYPLQGQQILVTRPEHQASDLEYQLSLLGAIPITCPVVEIIPVINSSMIQNMLQKLSQYDWILFTSANGVYQFVEHLKKNGFNYQHFDQAIIGAVGEKTVQALKQVGIHCHMVPPSYHSEALVATLKKLQNLEHKKILMPRSKIARKEIVELLQAEGSFVDDVSIYDTCSDNEWPEEMINLIQKETLDWVTFTSSSAVHAFKKKLDTFHLTMPQNLLIASIGPTTSQTIYEYGWHVAVQANPSTIESLVNAIAKGKQTQI